ncbi:MAG: hypothetical protein ISP83_05305 [Candidatus Poseidonia sp.]|nr:hypothetical protein [Poseidonia sp.]MBL6748186.1 hypothetical protein [Poseidonia sp.]MBL6806861.1 hypothetical protein [Poseidonia sp.]MBL6885459.1 hypothetical protein [Candidatus Poseidoniaceae archaeon]MBL6886582.1 hypothetical protein [Poseidonia sp.]
MQAGEPAKRSPWAMRLAIAGAIMVVVGIVLVSSQSSRISEAMDPRENYHQTYVGPGSEVTGQLDDTCYRFYQLKDDPEMSVELFRVEGSSISGEAIDEASCKLDFQPMTEEGDVLVERASWKLNESSEYAVTITCATSCEGVQGWFSSIDAFQNKLFESTTLLFGATICCFGVFTTPIALIIYLASKPSKTPRVMMVGEDGRLIPITDLNPDNPVLFGQPQEQIRPEQSPSVAPPFADTAEQNQPEEFVDGLPDVASGNLLTTEQVYALMKGDVEAAQEHARSGRYQGTSAEDAIEEAANVAAIASWDEGVSLAKPVNEPTPNQRQNPKPLRDTSPTVSDQSWKEWEEL